MPHRKTKKPPPQYRGRESKLPPDHIGRIDMIVAEIREVINHPTYSYNYFVATVNVGRLFSMLIESSLASAFTAEQLMGRKVVMCFNIKPQWVRTRDAHALVMVARTGDAPEIVETLIPPEDSVPGDVVHCEGYPRDPDRPWLNPYRDVFQNVMSFMRIDDDLRLLYKYVPLTVERTGGFIKTGGLRNLCFIDAM